MDDHIILDKESFKALAAGSRVSILKSLKERRMTLSELSKKLSLEASTVKEHCTILTAAQLIEQIDEGHKWKYYALTPKGKQVIMPNESQPPKYFILLTIGAILFGAIILIALQGTFLTSTGIASSAENSVMKSFASTDTTQGTGDVLAPSQKSGGSNPLMATSIASTTSNTRDGNVPRDQNSARDTNTPLDANSP